jgi:hypothetical protein
MSKLNCVKCYNYLKNTHDIDCDKDCDVNAAKKKLKKEALKHHPDKGGDASIFKKMWECGDIVIEKQCMKDDYIDPGGCNPSQNKFRPVKYIPPTCVRKKGAQKVENHVPTDKKPCPSNYYQRKAYVRKESCIPFENEEDETRYQKKFMLDIDNQHVKLFSMYLGSFPSKLLSVDYQLIQKIEKNRKRVKLTTPPPSISVFNRYIWWANYNGGLPIAQVYAKIKSYYSVNGFYYTYKYTPAPPIRKKKSCDGGEGNRSLQTRRCMKPCVGGKIRNPDTNRCKKSDKVLTIGNETKYDISVGYEHNYKKLWISIKTGQEGLIPIPDNFFVDIVADKNDGKQYIDLYDYYVFYYTVYTKKLWPIDEETLIEYKNLIEFFENRWVIKNID